VFPQAMNDTCVPGATVGVEVVTGVGAGVEGWVGAGVAVGQPLVTQLPEPKHE